MQIEPTRFRTPALKVLFFLTGILTLLLASCQLTQEGKEVNTLSFTSMYDSLSKYDNVIIVVKDEASGAVDTIFNGKVDAASKIQGLVAPNYSGKTARIEIIGLNGGVVVSRVERVFDGTSDATIQVVVKVIPNSSVTAEVDSLRMRVGDTRPLPKTTVAPPGLADTSLTWTSTEINVLAVEGSNLIAKAVGRVDLSARLASDPAKRAVIRVTVISADSVLPMLPEPPAISSLNPGDAKVSVSWSAAVGIDEYNLYYGEGASVDKNSTRVKKVSSPWEVKALKNGTLYAFALAAVNAAGESALGPVQTATPQAAPADAPAIDSVQAGNGVVTFTWRPVANALGYILYYKAGSTVDMASSRIPGITSPYSLTGLVNGTQYAFALTALTAAGESGLSPTVTATPKAPPVGALSYAVNPVVYWVSLAVAPNAATVSGLVDSFTISPSLPAGLTLDKATGRIQGTPTAAAARADYAVKAHGSNGTVTALLTLTVNPAPTGLSYREANPTYWQSVAIVVNSATVTGIVDSFSIVPPLPFGLALSRTTGAISGTPASIAATATHTVTAHNPAGAATATLTIQVKGAPSGFSYSMNPASYWQGVAIAANAAAISGTVDSFTVAPALPAGLSLSKSTGAITGTPAAASGPADYVVTARNASGSPTVTLNLTVKGQPSGLTYNTLTAVYNRTFAISTNAATVIGTVDSFTVSPALPAGLSLNKSTGSITGTPTAISAAANYTVTARNHAGSTTATLSIAVQDPISGLSYLLNPAVYWRGVTIVVNTVSITGAPDSFTVSPTLPAGLSLNKSTGAVTGTPTAVALQATYVVTARIGGVAVTANLVLTVKEAASGLSYTNAAPIYHRSYAISANSASLSGIPDSFKVAPALPVGLSLNKATGAITGTPTASTAQAAYTVTAHVGPTTVTARLDITVRELISGFSYSPNPRNFWHYVALPSPVTPSISGVIDSITVSPGLPGGLLLEKATGAITGTPHTAISPAVYVFTAKGGPVTLTFNWTLAVHTAPYITYPVQAANYTQGFAITANIPSAVPFGTIDSFKIAPALPAGLSILKSTGTISGAPTSVSSATNYVVTAWNGGGTGKDTISIAVTLPGTSTTLNSQAETSLDTANGGYNGGFGPATYIHKPGRPYFGVYKFDLAGLAQNGLKSAKVRFKSYGVGTGWTGNSFNVTLRVHRLRTPWTEGTGNWYWHRNAYQNNGAVILANYLLSDAIKTASTDPADSSGLRYTQKEFVRPANLALVRTETKTIAYPAASTHTDYSTPIPGPANLIDLEIDLTDYVQGVLTNDFVDCGFTVSVEGLPSDDTAWMTVLHKEAGDGNANESDGNYGPKLILTY